MTNDSLSLTRECEMSGIIEAFCAHCTGDEEIDVAEGYEIVAQFESQYSGHCTIDWDHKIKRGDTVARVRHADNPMIPVPGVACKNCTKTLPKAAR